MSNKAIDSSCFDFLSEFLFNLFIAHEQPLLFVMIIMSQRFSVFLFSLVFGESIPLFQLFHIRHVRVNIEFLRCLFLVLAAPTALILGGIRCRRVLNGGTGLLLWLLLDTRARIGA